MKKELCDIMPNSINTINKLFKKSGKKLYLVGGSVRDYLMGDEPKDYDLATDALPDEVIDIIKNDYKYNVQGKAFGVVVVYTHDQPMGMEIATFREDLTLGRNPEVKLGVTIEDDVKRRDLRINGLFYDIDRKEIIDLVGGIDDIRNGVTRTIGDPIERFNEDSLRILRSFRFSARYNYPLSKETEKAIHKRKELSNIDVESGELKRISQERIWEEFYNKAFKQSKDYNFYLNFFNKFDMWNEVFPGSNINENLIESNNFIVILSNLLLNEKLDGLEHRMIHKYKIDSDITKKVLFLLKFIEFEPDNVYDVYKSKVQSNIDDNTILEWIELNKLSDKHLKFLNYKPSISATELMDKGFKGAELGKEIKRLEINKFKKL